MMSLSGISDVRNPFQTSRRWPHGADRTHSIYIETSTNGNFRHLRQNLFLLHLKPLLAFHCLPNKKGIFNTTSILALFYNPISSIMKLCYVTLFCSLSAALAAATVNTTEAVEGGVTADLKESHSKMINMQQENIVTESCPLRDMHRLAHAALALVVPSGR
ncbi:uncharacterized protein LMH87_008558 [Akanthomyces muscarius]|uniref:Uncharacterized protein n=1 Tax=Akanthomyces muscarius TaxID=2231603 RepID=A0A9W8QGK5_AKAMU|nr:uncharacterized protein LMH87_008558 [Akanthomyces muscarius]KAJ4158011.1 hypothetical protein LMH87_008558 [Akanthomyces muscarius]